VKSQLSSTTTWWILYLDEPKKQNVRVYSL